MPRTVKTKNGGQFIVPDIGIIEWSKDSGNDFVPKIKVGETYILEFKGEDLATTKELRPFMPFLNAYVSNQSGQPIRVQIGNQRRSGYTIAAKRARAISEIPFTEMMIFNKGTEPIAEDEIKIICSNDLTTILKYAEAVERNLIDPIIFRK
jgi:hypothetical protein